MAQYFENDSVTQERVEMEFVVKWIAKSGVAIVAYVNIILAGFLT